MRDAMTAARYVLALCADEGTPVNNWRLQRILYALQGAFYRAFQRPCFSDAFEAWACGPVVPAVYYAYCAAGASPIARPAEDASACFAGDEKKTADEVIRQKGALHPWYLERDVKKEGRAWALTWQNGAGRGAVIPDERIRTEG